MLSMDTARESLFILSSNLLKLGLGFLITLMLASGLGPEQFGAYSQVVNIALMISAFADFGMNVTYVRLYGIRSTDPESLRLHWARGVFTARVILSVVTLAAAWFVLPLFASSILSPGIGTHLLRISCILIVTEGLFAFVLAYFQAGQQFGQYSILNPLPNLIRFALLGLLSLAGALTIDDALMAIIFAGAAVLVIGVIINPGIRPRRLEREDISRYRGIYTWGKWLLLQTVANTIMVKLDLIMLGYYRLSSETIGNYALGLYFASLITIVQTTAITILLPRVSALKTREAVQAYLKKVPILTAIVLPAILVVGIVGSRAIGTFYGTDYPHAAGVFGYLIAAFGVSFLVTPVTILSFTLDMPYILAAQNVVGLIVGLIGQLLLIPLWGITGSAVAVVLARVISEAVGIIAVYVRLPRYRFGLPSAVPTGLE